MPARGVDGGVWNDSLLQNCCHHGGFSTHQSATQISIWELSSSSCHTPSITKSTSCLLKHHLGRGDDRTGGGVESPIIQVTAQKSPPPRSLP